MRVDPQIKRPANDRHYYEPPPDPSPVRPMGPWGWLIAGVATFLLATGYLLCREPVQEATVHFSSDVDTQVQQFNEELIISQRHSFE
ncbi:MAG: hypothetical protein AB202_01460 [Parcubacteria bacterium C7867-007]|nr:MAG: hypothetical protein AB202_01460 [Parcubacteria bacterium C7867-007]